MKKSVSVLIKIAIPLIVAGIVCGAVALLVHFGQHYHSTLQYCIWEISSHEDYDEGFTYYYETLSPQAPIQEEADKGCEIFCYYITCFTEDRKGEWYCFIEVKSKALFKMYRGYRPEEVVAIDCDLAFETLYE